MSFVGDKFILPKNPPPAVIMSPKTDEDDYSGDEADGGGGNEDEEDETRRYSLPRGGVGADDRASLYSISKDEDEPSSASTSTPTAADVTTSGGLVNGSFSFDFGNFLIPNFGAYLKTCVGLRVTLKTTLTCQ